MSEHPVEYKSLKILYLWFISGTIIFFVLGYLVSHESLPVTDIDLLSHFLWFLGLPFCVAILDFYLGWILKRNNLNYSAPKWEYDVIQLKIEEAKKLPKAYNRKFSRLVAVPNYWYYFLPIVIIIFQFTLPLYSFYIDSSFIDLIPTIFATSLGFLHLFVLWASWRSTSCKASGDFTLPLIREAAKLAETQLKIVGFSHIRILLDKAEYSGLEIYRKPRVIARVSGIEEAVYIESRTDEFGSIDRVLIRSYKSDNIPEIIWWWTNRDRNFRKYVGEKEDGYYVKPPVPSRVSDLGVKDVCLVFENALALLLIERLRLYGPNDSLSSILSALGVQV
ncbi:MAG: hypothetical protein P1Q69_08660 [Candidatus Thorarchaeota archaeon]|nr:hypothetical protein [Candidatus Thorarchaeota archaeon]